MQKRILIIDKRKELSTKYKKLIEDGENTVEICHKLDLALKFINDFQPELILVSDSIEENLADFCKKIRVLTYNSRPVILAVSKSAELEDKLKALDSGADDFLSEPINSQEFSMRIKAHLRRDWETNLDKQTLLPNPNYSLKLLKRLLANQSDWACLLISIDNLAPYNEIYTQIAGEKLIRTYLAIITSSLDENDYLGHLGPCEFLVITNSIKAEKIASFLTFAFDAVSPKFYNEQDSKRGYTIARGDEFAGKRSELVSSTIGVVTNKFRKYTELKQILNELSRVHRLAQKPNGSSYLIVRPEISSPDFVCAPEYNNGVLIIEQDEALSFLLNTSLSIQGYKPISLEDCLMSPPAVAILDLGENNSGLEFCKMLKAKNTSTKIIVTSIVHDKEMVLNAGADLYLPKPYEISALIKWVEILIKEYN